MQTSSRACRSLNSSSVFRFPFSVLIPVPFRCPQPDLPLLVLREGSAHSAREPLFRSDSGSDSQLLSPVYVLHADPAFPFPSPFPFLFQLSAGGPSRARAACPTSSCATVTLRVRKASRMRSAPLARSVSFSPLTFPVFAGGSPCARVHGRPAHPARDARLQHAVQCRHADVNRDCHDIQQPVQHAAPEGDRKARR